MTDGSANLDAAVPQLDLGVEPAAALRPGVRLDAVEIVNWGTFAGAVCFAVGGVVQVFIKPTTTRTVVQHTP